MNVKYRLILISFYYAVILILGFFLYIKNEYPDGTIYFWICFVAVAFQTLVYLKNSSLPMPYFTIPSSYKIFSRVYLIFVNILFLMSFMVLIK